MSERSNDLQAFFDEVEAEYRGYACETYGPDFRSVDEGTKALVQETLEVLDAAGRVKLSLPPGRNKDGTPATLRDEAVDVAVLAYKFWRMSNRRHKDGPQLRDKG